MKAYTRRRLLASVKLGLAATPFSVPLRLVHHLPIVPGTFITGCGLGFAVGVAELFWLRTRFKRLSFPAHVAVKSIAIVACMYAAFAILSVLDVVIAGISWRAYAAVLLSPNLLVSLLEGLGVIAFLLFFVEDPAP